MPPLVTLQPPFVRSVFCVLLAMENALPAPAANEWLATPICRDAELQRQCVFKFAGCEESFFAVWQCICLFSMHTGARACVLVQA
jgi:hypothetical protein